MHTWEQTGNCASKLQLHECNYHSSLQSAKNIYVNTQLHLQMQLYVLSV